jgi:hypothetical protein
MWPKHQTVLPRPPPHGGTDPQHGRGCVASRLGYAPGDRGMWVKSKCLNREEFVVVGWTDPPGGGKVRNNRMERVGLLLLHGRAVDELHLNRAVWSVNESNLAIFAVAEISCRCSPRG